MPNCTYVEMLISTKKENVEGTGQGTHEYDEAAEGGVDDVRYRDLPLQYTSMLVSNQTSL